MEEIKEFMKKWKDLKKKKYLESMKKELSNVPKNTVLK
jgi:hypothetical protein